MEHQRALCTISTKYVSTYRRWFVQTKRQKVQQICLYKSQHMLEASQLSHLLHSTHANLSILDFINQNYELVLKCIAYINHRFFVTKQHRYYRNCMFRSAWFLTLTARANTSILEEEELKCPPLLTLQLMRFRSTVFAFSGPSWLANHDSATFWQSFTTCCCPGSIIAWFAWSDLWSRPPAIWIPMLFKTGWQTGSSVHSFKGSTDWHASKNRVVLTNCRKSFTPMTGHKPPVRFAGWAEQSFATLLLAPRLIKRLRVSEKQNSASVLLRARVPDFKLCWPRETCIRLSSCGQQITLPK